MRVPIGLVGPLCIMMSRGGGNGPRPVWTTTDGQHRLACVVLPAEPRGFVVRVLVDDEPQFGRVCATADEAARVARAWWEDSTRGRL